MTVSWHADLPRPLDDIRVAVEAAFKSGVQTDASGGSGPCGSGTETLASILVHPDVTINHMLSVYFSFRSIIKKVITDLIVGSSGVVGKTPLVLKGDIKGDPSLVDVPAVDDGWMTSFQIIVINRRRIKVENLVVLIWRLPQDNNSKSP